MKKDPEIFLKHILESIENVQSFVLGRNKQDFKTDQMLQSAVVRQIEIIGEATKNIPKAFTSKHPGVQWAEIAGTRDKMIHYYFGVDLDLVWNNIIKEDIPKLKKQIQKILGETKEK